MAVLSKKLFATTIGPVGQAELQQREWHTDTTAHGVFYGIRGEGGYPLEAPTPSTQSGNFIP